MSRIDELKARLATAQHRLRESRRDLGLSHPSIRSWCLQAERAAVYWARRRLEATAEFDSVLDH